VARGGNGRVRGGGYKFSYLERSYQYHNLPLFHSYCNYWAAWLTFHKNAFIPMALQMALMLKQEFVVNTWLSNHALGRPACVR